MELQNSSPMKRLEFKVDTLRYKLSLVGIINLKLNQQEEAMVKLLELAVKYLILLI